MKRLQKLKPTRGLAMDTPPHEVGPDYWTAGRNVQFRTGFAGRVHGSRAVYGVLPADIMHLLNNRVATTNYWLAFGRDSVYALETVNTDEITPVGGLTAIAQPWQIQSTLLNGVACFTNGLDPPHYWPGGAAQPCEVLPGWPAGTSCRGLVAFNYHLFALDIDGPGGVFSDQVLWSSAAEPGAVPTAWIAAADNDAGSAQLADTPGPVLAAMPLRGSLALYKRAGTYAADYTRDPDQVYSFRRMFGSSGILTRRGGCDINGQHFLVTDGDIILTDGTNRRSVGEARFREFLFSQLDQEHYENLFCVFHRARGEVWTCFPESGHAQCTLALVYDIGKDAFGIRDLPAATCAALGVVNDEAVSEDWDDDSGYWDADISYWNATNYSLATESLVIGTETRALEQDTDDAVVLPAMVAKYDMDFGAGERLKFVRRVHVRKAPGSGTLFVRVGARMTTDDEIRWGGEVELPEGRQIANLTALGRYISLELRSEGAQRWVITGAELEAELRGYH